MLEFARISLGEGAPASCARCGSIAAPASYSSLAELREAVGIAIAGEGDPTGPNVCLAGPEPFGHPDLPQLVVACVDAGARRIALETDAAALSVARNAQGVISAGVHHLHARLLDTDPVRCEALGVPAGRTSDSLAGIENYREAAQAASVPVVISILVPVCPHNLPWLPEIVVSAAGLHAQRVRLHAAAPLPGSAPALIAAACDTGMVSGVWVEAEESLGLPTSHRLHTVAGACR